MKQFIELDTKEGQNRCIYTVKQKDSPVIVFLKAAFNTEKTGITS